MLLLDEAGLLSDEALRGVCLVLDTASAMDWHLSIVLIGMDDLPRKVERCPQLQGRVREWCYFKPYSLDQTWEFLAALHPHFAKLDRRIEEDRAQVEFVQRSQQGLPRNLDTFLRKLDNFVSGSTSPITLPILMAVDQWTALDKNFCIDEATKGWPAPEVAPEDAGLVSDPTVPSQKRNRGAAVRKKTVAA